MTRLEHVNVTVADPLATAAVLERLFGWRIRWQGPAKLGGFTVHLGDDAQYLALYTPPKGLGPAVDPGLHQAGLNHIGLLVDDLDAVGARIRAAGYAGFFGLAGYWFRTRSHIANVCKKPYWLI